MRFPCYLNIDERLASIVTRWIDSIPEDERRERFEQALEEDCAPMSPVVFEVTAGSVADNIRVKFCRRTLDIGYDDDGDPYASERHDDCTGLGSKPFPTA